jgi:hypothetical protein
VAVGGRSGLGGLLVAGAELADATLLSASGSLPAPQAAHASTSSSGAMVFRTMVILAPDDVSLTAERRH